MSWIPLLPIVGGTTIPPFRTGMLSRGGDYNNVVVAWRGAVAARSAYMPRSPENARASECRICDDSLCSSCREHIRSPSTSCNHILNTRVNRHGVIGRVRLINNVCCKFPLLVSVTFPLFPSLVLVATFGLLAGFHFSSFLSDS